MTDNEAELIVALLRLTKDASAFFRLTDRDDCPWASYREAIKLVAKIKESTT